MIDKIHNRISKIKSKTFHELGFRERENLQEWIAKNPSCLGDEELLIIQKEFDGFNDTNERLDLLALDKAGSLVVIETENSRFNDSSFNTSCKIVLLPTPLGPLYTISNPFFISTIVLLSSIIILWHLMELY